MTHQATFNVDLDTLRLLLGLPDDFKIVRLHSLPNQYADMDAVRFVVESPRLPPVASGEEIPTVVPAYDVNGSYRRLTGFKQIVMTEQPVVGVDAEAEEL